MAKDFYSVLDIAPETEKEDIRKAYLQLARLYHPDVSKAPDARERFEEIYQAYSILSDDDSRFFYNLYFRAAQEISDRQEPLPSLKSNDLALSIGMLALAALVFMCLLLFSASLNFQV